MVNEPIITLDFDWAPDFVIEYCAKILSEKKVKATWYVTHQSPILETLRSNKLFELGIHPNFLISSTQGDSLRSVLTNLKKIVPEATTVRTHSLIQSIPLISEFHKFGIENDVSVLLPRTNGLSPHFSKYFKLIRFPYYWQDDIAMAEEENWEISSIDYQENGLKIFDFHPIHIYLNSKTMMNYNIIKESNLSLLTPKNAEKFINKNSSGTFTLFDKITDYLSQRKSYSIHDLQEIFHPLLVEKMKK